MTLVEQLDLSSWQGKTGNAMRVLQGAFPPALRNTVSAARELEAANSAWAAQLSGFQAEADALERRAASISTHQQALMTQQAAPLSASSALTGELESASANLAAISLRLITGSAHSRRSPEYPPTG